MVPYKFSSQDPTTVQFKVSRDGRTGFISHIMPHTKKICIKKNQFQSDLYVYSMQTINIITSLTVHAQT
jgi:hypothetical protein